MSNNLKKVEESSMWNCGEREVEETEEPLQIPQS